MFLFKIQGAHYAIVGEKYVNYFVETMDLPAGVDPAGVKITWYKDGNEMEFYDWEDKTDWFLYDVDFPAAGNYYAIAEVDGYTARSNTIELEIGREYREIKLVVNSRTRVEANIGDVVTFAPECIVDPPYILRDCIWTRGGVELGPDEFISVPITDASAYGTYNLHTNAYSRSGFIPINQVNPLEIVPVGSGIVCDTPMKIHDLNWQIEELGGGRDRGYVWVGWWVMDEIIDAMIEGFKWQDDPQNPRFKYPCEIGIIAEGFKKYPDLELQESRHGYILNKRDVWVY